MNNKITRAVAILICILLSAALCGCTPKETGENNKNNETAYRYNAEYQSLIFDSVDDLKQTLKDYNTNDEMKADPKLARSNFSDMKLEYIPTMKDLRYKLLFIEVNQYRIFYYFVPKKEKTFDYAYGIVVTFSRESGASIKIVGDQFNAVYEKDGSFYYEKGNEWFIPLENDYYYSISFPENSKPNKNIITLHKETNK